MGEVAAPPFPLPDSSAVSEDDRIFGIVEEMPSFPGGPQALMEYLKDNVQYPPTEACVQGRVIVSFVVEKDGSITDVKTVRSVDPAFDREAERVVKAMPKWVPGKQNGILVRTRYNVPVTFRLQ